MGDGRITPRDVYEAVTGMEQRLLRRIDATYEVTVKVRQDVSALKVQVENNQERIEHLEEDVDALEKSDKKWTGISSLVSAVVAAVVAWLSSLGE